MILTLIAKCVRGSYLKEQCIRRIEIDESNTLYDLHMAIQDAVEFDNDHLYDFYAGRGPRNRKVTFVDEEREEGSSSYDEVRLNQVYPLPKLKLYYLFDYGDHWLFEITKARGQTRPEFGVTYPRVIERIGPNPKQYGDWDE